MPITRRRILLQDLAVEVQIGIHDFERRGPQRILVTVEVDLAPDDGPSDDRIDQVLNYDLLRDGVRHLAGARAYDLQETLCAAILDMAVAHRAVIGARVATAKPDVYPDCRSVGYELTFRRDG